MVNKNLRLYNIVLNRQPFAILQSSITQEKILSLARIPDDEQEYHDVHWKLRNDEGILKPNTAINLSCGTVQFLTMRRKITGIPEKQGTPSRKQEYIWTFPIKSFKEGQMMSIETRPLKVVDRSVILLMEAKKSYWRGSVWIPYENLKKAIKIPIISLIKTSMPLKRVIDIELDEFWNSLDRIRFFNDVEVKHNRR